MRVEIVIFDCKVQLEENKDSGSKESINGDRLSIECKKIYV